MCLKILRMDQVGSSAWVRTTSLTVNGRLLYQLSYRGTTPLQCARRDGQIQSAVASVISSPPFSIA